MITNHLVQYLKSSGSLEQLKEKYGLSIKSHKFFPNLLHFSYSQIDSPLGDPIVRDARGTVLDSQDNWRVISYSLRKFFRHNEGHADKIDWNSARVLEKLDGSAIFVWNYKNSWQISTTGTPDGFSPSGEMSKDLNSKIYTWEPEPNVVLSVPRSFCEYFWMIMRYRYPELFLKFENNEINTDMCFTFELMGKYNPVVVRHNRPDVVLIAARNRLTLQEIWPEKANMDYLWGLASVVKEFSLTSLQEVLKSLETLPPLEHEGYVVLDKRFNRIKCKSPAYDALHYMKDQFSEKHFLELIRIGEYSEVVAAFPNYLEDISKLEEHYFKLIKVLEEQVREYFSLGLEENRKAFALIVKNSLCPSLMFLILDKRVRSVSDYLKQIKIEKLQELLQKVKDL